MISASDYHFAGVMDRTDVDSELPDSDSKRPSGPDVYNAQPWLRSCPHGKCPHGGGGRTNWRSWNGFEVILDGELPRGGFMTASFTGGKSEDPASATAGIEQLTPTASLNCRYVIALPAHG